MGFSTGKVSVALLIYRLQAPSKLRTSVLAFLSISSLIMAVIIVILFFAQCSPTSALWTPNAGSCWDPKPLVEFDIVASSRCTCYKTSPDGAKEPQGYWAFVDFFLALFPITFLWNLQMSLKKRVLSCMLLGLGVL